MNITVEGDCILLVLNFQSTEVGFIIIHTALVKTMNIQVHLPCGLQVIDT